jgi:hypothetical protein
MHKLTTQSLQDLLEMEATPKVTIYIPLEASAAPPNISENQIRLKNLIHAALNQLKEMGDSKLSEQLRDFLDQNNDDVEFWKDKTHGMLILAADNRLMMFDLPVDTEEYIAVDDTFHLAPILALMGDNREYYVLALAQQNPKVYKGDMYGLEYMDIGLPINMRAGLGIDEANQQSENQGSATGSSLNTGWFNGRGGARDPQDADRLKFFQLIDKQIHDKLDRSLPLMLAGIDAEVAEYKELSKYPKIMDGFIAGNHTDTQTIDLFEKAQPIIHAELVSPEHAAALEEYERLLGANPDRVAREQDHIIAAAEQGRIDKLLAMMGRNTTDTVQDSMKSVYRITFPEKTDTSRLLNNLAMKVWQMSGKVVSLLPSEMPNGATMVARLRY